MRRMAFESMLVIALLAGAGCDKHSVPTAAAPAPTTAAAPAPARPAPPVLDAGPARDAALAKGPGTCEQDVPAIRQLPANGELGVDPGFDRIAVHREAYKACLVGMVRDATPIADPGPEPKRNPYAPGDLASDLLAAVGFIQYGECLDPAVAKRAASEGRQVVSAWLAAPNPRRQVLRCLGKRLGT
jgi:hypothetical protein